MNRKTHMGASKTIKKHRPKRTGVLHDIDVIVANQNRKLNRRYGLDQIVRGPRGVDITKGAMLLIRKLKNYIKINQSWMATRPIPDELGIRMIYGWKKTLKLVEWGYKKPTPRECVPTDSIGNKDELDEFVYGKNLQFKSAWERGELDYLLDEKK